MHAIELNGFGGPEVMEWTVTVDPEPGPGEVLVEVIAAGVNRADLLQRRGLYPPPADASSVLGLECSGTIVALGTGVTDWQVGDRVCALLSGGGYAEVVAVPATQLLPIPDGLDPVAAAGLPEVAATVWSNLVMTAGMRAGQLVLLHGGGGGIGTHAIQVARRCGARVAVTAGSDEKLARCAELGAEVLINYRTQDFVEVIASESPAGADIILDNMGATYLERNVEALAPHGQLVVIGMQGGVNGTLNLGALLRKWGTVHATNVRSRPRTGVGSKAEIVAAVRAQLWPQVAAGDVVPVISAEVPIAEAARAHEMLDEPDTFGKVILRLRD
ncbi:NAD(P)H-quinone oxidoreductase [Nocardia mangyaensis]|uniref:NAD(P)H-quinone oxidoreductase n=1 Tax=Nocardia mangyaensis TaxID=2213200 RepID=A0A1J0VL91_9NOCA|nr:NAD(P)H-quinone oxidoreductase [Nocardia mangyaensis]APE32782.1 NAD(P)H-quinone oxidoreductase [Nocardia mangyaensis]